VTVPVSVKVSVELWSSDSDFVSSSLSDMVTSSEREKVGECEAVFSEESVPSVTDIVRVEVELRERKMEVEMDMESVYSTVGENVADCDVVGMMVKDSVCDSSSVIDMVSVEDTD